MHIGYYSVYDGFCIRNISRNALKLLYTLLNCSVVESRRKITKKLRLKNMFNQRIFSSKKEYYFLYEYRKWPYHWENFTNSWELYSKYCSIAQIYPRILIFNSRRSRLINKHLLFKIFQAKLILSSEIYIISCINSLTESVVVSCYHLILSM